MGTQERLSERGEFIVRGAYVLTMEPAMTDIPKGDVHVRGGEIVAVGTDLDAPGAEVIDGQGLIALPGFVETHWHLWSSPYRSLAGDGPETGYFATLHALDPVVRVEDMYRGTLLGLGEAINAGITTVHNWAHNTQTPDYAAAGLRALTEAGVRGRFSYAMPGEHPFDELMPFDDIRRVQSDWFGGRGEGLLTMGVGMQTAWGQQASEVGMKTLRADWDAARTLGLPISIHVAEAGELEKLSGAGLLGPDVQIVHAVLATSAEREMLAASGAHLSISPVSEMRMGFGFPQVGEMLALGVLVCLSLDSQMAAGSADMFAAMRMALDTHYARTRDTVSVTPRRALEMATIDGARALGLADRTGSLKPGKRADLILVRTTDLNVAPLVDPVRMLVHAAGPHNVDTVVIDGRILKRGGKLTALDPEQLVREAAESVAAVQARLQLATAAAN